MRLAGHKHPGRHATILTVPVVLILASAAILAGVVGVAIGRGGEMAEFAGDYPPCEADDLMTAADVALLRPPSALWGYNVQATDEAPSFIRSGSSPISLRPVSRIPTSPIV